jgi:hypothetical protein
MARDHLSFMLRCSDNKLVSYILLSSNIGGM